MSGGSMNYLYSKVLHCADFPLDTPERIAFAAHLKLVAQALHDIEWVDSGDYGPGDENAAIRACLSERKPLPNHDQHCVDVPGYGLMAVRLVRAVERAHGIGEGK